MNFKRLVTNIIRNSQQMKIFWSETITLLPSLTPLKHIKSIPKCTTHPYILTRGQIQIDSAKRREEKYPFIKSWLRSCLSAKIMKNCILEQVDILKIATTRSQVSTRSPSRCLTVNLIIWFCCGSVKETAATTEALQACTVIAFCLLIWWLNPMDLPLTLIHSQTFRSMILKSKRAAIIHAEKTRWQIVSVLFGHQQKIPRKNKTFYTVCVQ